MARNPIAIDDQPISAGFFGEGSWLTSFITPDSFDVKTLYDEVTGGITDTKDKMIACWQWVASKVKYVKFVKGRIWINGRSSVQNDLWQTPALVINTRIGNCANKSFLLCSLLRNLLPADEVYCTLGNLHNGKPGGHAWVELNLPEGEYIMESTMPTAPPLVPVNAADRYEAVHYFNDEVILAIPDKTQMIPFTACYSDWLSSYLNWAYIQR